MGAPEFVEGDLVTTTAFNPALEGLQGNLVREPEGTNFPWRFILTVESQAVYFGDDKEALAQFGEVDRLTGWPVLEDEIQKVVA